MPATRRSVGAWHFGSDVAEAPGPTLRVTRIIEAGMPLGLLRLAPFAKGKSMLSSRLTAAVTLVGILIASGAGFLAEARTEITLRAGDGSVVLRPNDGMGGLRPLLPGDGSAARAGLRQPHAGRGTGARMDRDMRLRRSRRSEAAHRAGRNERGGADGGGALPSGLRQLPRLRSRDARGVDRSGRRDELHPRQLRERGGAARGLRCHPRRRRGGAGAGLRGATAR